MNKILKVVLTQKEYREHKALNYSKIKTFEISPLYYKNLIDGNIEEEKKDYYNMGSAIHCAVLEPKRFERNYVRLPMKRIDGIIGKFIHNLAYLIKDNMQLISNGIWAENQCKEAYSILTTNWKFETLISKFNEPENKEYYNFLINNGNKTVLTESEYSTIIECKNSILAHKASERILLIENSEVEFPIIWKYNNIMLKSKLDKVIIDEEERIVYIIELKTTGKPVSEFYKSYIMYKYYMQLAFYLDAIRCLFEANNYLDYTFKTIIIAVETKPFYETKVFEISDNDIIDGRDKYTKILKSIEWHTKNNKWKYPKEYYNDNGIEKIEKSVGSILSRV